MNDESLLSLEMKISRFLRVGVLVAGGFLLAGWLLQIQFTENPFLEFSHYRNIPLADSLSEAVAAGNVAQLIAYTGLLVLIALPVTRVFLTAVLFLRRRELLMAAVAVFVLIALALSVMLGWEI